MFNTFHIHQMPLLRKSLLKVSGKIRLNLCMKWWVLDFFFFNVGKMTWTQEMLGNESSSVNCSASHLLKAGSALGLEAELNFESSPFSICNLLPRGEVAFIHLFLHLFIHSLGKYLLSSYQVPGTNLTFIGDTAENNKDSVLAVIELISRWSGEAD